MEKRSIDLNSAGVRLAGEVYLPASEGPHPALCICHGVPSGNPPDPNDGGYPLLARRFCAEGFITLIFNFRGTGQSEGNFDILDWTVDLRAALKYLASLDAVDDSRLSVMGFSGGAAVSVYVAARDARIRSLVSCACPAQFRMLFEGARWQDALKRFRSIGLFRDPDFPQSPECWALGFKAVQPLRWVERVSPRPLLLIHGDHDEVVAPSHAHRMYERAGEPKDLLMVPGAGHRLRLDQEAMDRALSWLKRQSGLDQGERRLDTPSETAAEQPPGDQ